MNTLQRIEQLKTHISFLNEIAPADEKEAKAIDDKIADLQCQMDCHLEHCE